MVTKKQQFAGSSGQEFGEDVESVVLRSCARVAVAVVAVVTRGWALVLDIRSWVVVSALHLDSKPTCTTCARPQQIQTSEQ